MESLTGVAGSLEQMEFDQELRRLHRVRKAWHRELWLRGWWMVAGAGLFLAGMAVGAWIH